MHVLYVFTAQKLAVVNLLFFYSFGELGSKIKTAFTNSYNINVTVRVRLVVFMSEQKAWLDMALIQCPSCGRYYADASWYVVEIGSDIECGICHEDFNSKKYVKDRVMLELSIDEKGKVKQVKIARRP